MSRGSYDNIKNTQEEDNDETPSIWTSEVVRRHGGFVVIFFLGDQAKGQVNVDTHEEAELWVKQVGNLNS